MPTPTPARRSRVRADVFPAAATVQKNLDGEAVETLPKCRVVVTLDEIIVLVDSPAGPATHLRARLASYTPPPPPRTLTLRSSAPPSARTGQATLDDGRVVTFSRSQGCACGSRLRAADPFSLSSAPAQASSPGEYSAASSRDV